MIRDVPIHNQEDLSVVEALPENNTVPHRIPLEFHFDPPRQRQIMLGIKKQNKSSPPPNLTE